MGLTEEQKAEFMQWFNEMIERICEMNAMKEKYIGNERISALSVDKRLHLNNEAFMCLVVASDIVFTKIEKMHQGKHYISYEAEHRGVRVLTIFDDEDIKKLEGREHEIISD